MPDDTPPIAEAIVETAAQAIWERASSLYTWQELTDCASRGIGNCVKQAEGTREDARAALATIVPDLLTALDDLLYIAPDNWNDDEDPETMQAWDRAFATWRKVTGLVRMCPGVAKCRVCGCTDNDCSGCIERTGEPCYWVSEDLCSACGPATPDA